MLQTAWSGVRLFAFALLLVSAQAQEAKPQSTERVAQSADTPAAHKYFTDVELVDQDGKTMRLYSDLLKGKVVVINSFYAAEHDTCAAMFRNLEKLQAALGDHVGKDIFFISITVDPLTDTPPRLNTFAQKFHARPGWSFLTGKKENIDFALSKLGMYVENREDHLMILIVGNEPAGLWKKAFALAKIEDLVKIVEASLVNK
jgi:protein SCO1/2